jgi:putative oxidoreductase
MRRLVPVNLDLALLILRVVLAAVMLAHGLPKITGFSGIAGFFASAGIPAPPLFALDMFGAIVFVHFKNGFSGQGGYEFPLTLLAVAVALALAGAGAYSVGGRK